MKQTMAWYVLLLLLYLGFGVQEREALRASLDHRGADARNDGRQGRAGERGDLKTAGEPVPITRRLRRRRSPSQAKARTRTNCKAAAKPTLKKDSATNVSA